MKIKKVHLLFLPSFLVETLFKLGILIICNESLIMSFKPIRSSPRSSHVRRDIRWRWQVGGEKAFAGLLELGEAHPAIAIFVDVWYDFSPLLVICLLLHV